MADNVTANPGAGGAVFASDDIGGVQYPRMKVTFGADGSATDVASGAPLPVGLRKADGTALGSLALATGLEGLMTAAGATDFYFSTANATTTQLGSGATFTGTVESIVSAQAWSIILTSDQPGTLTLVEYIDAGGTRITSSKTIAITANVPFSRCYTANGNYFRLTFQNTGGSATTTLNINTAFGVLPAVTSLGNAPVSLDEVAGTAFSLGVKAPSASLPVNLSNDVTVGAAASIAALNIDLLTGVSSGWYDAANSHSAAIQIIGSAGITAGAIFFEQTNDTTVAASGNIWPVEEMTGLTPTPNIAAITIAASTTRMFCAPVVSRYVRVRVSTAFATANVQAVGVFSQLPYVRPVQTVHQATAGNLNATVTATNLQTNINQWVGQTPMNPATNGSTNRALVASMATAASNVDQNATAFAGTGRVNGTIVASATSGGGACISGEINITALTLGAATAIVPILQESRGGTNFTDIWVGDPITATGIQSVPCIPVGGRRRWCMHSVGGASTTVTATITVLEQPAGYVKQAYFRDSYAATAALATVINSVTQTASTFGAATALTATTQATSWFPVEGCKQITAQLVLAGGPTVTTQPVIALEVSNDLTNGFAPAGATMTAAGNGTYACSVTAQSWRYARLRVTTAAAYSAGAYTISTASIYGTN